MTISKPAFIQGTYNFAGEGLEQPINLYNAEYIVPEGRSAKLVYFRAGQSSDDIVNLTLLRNGETMRLFPLGMKSSMHFPLAITEELPAGTKLELKLLAPKGISGSLFVDLGFMEERPEAIG